jgi:dCMP deaminase
MVKNDFIRPSWDESYMFSAISSATRSSCLKIKTGTVIVKDKRIIASGYNGAPPGIDNCLNRGCRKDEYKENFNHDKGTGNCRGVHAEINAMAQIARENLKGSILYTVFFPCSSCAKAIVGSGIIEVVYMKHYKEPDSLTRELFSEAGIKLRKLDIDVKSQCNRIVDIIKQF